ncbi:MAG: hypothetical protein R2762_03290 [Bryobacteraceae bacterium]
MGDLDARLRAAGELLRAIEFVGQYSGPPLPEDQKSVTFRITVGSADQTLSADEITAIRNRLIEAVREAGYQLRV